MLQPGYHIADGFRERTWLKPKFFLSFGMISQPTAFTDDNQRFLCVEGFFLAKCAVETDKGQSNPG